MNFERESVILILSPRGGEADESARIACSSTHLFLPKGENGVRVAK